MTRRLSALDRLAVLLIGLLLLAAGLLAVEWEWGTLLDLPATVDTSATSSVVESEWWPWAFAVAGVLLGLLGLAWLLAHLPRPGPSSARLGASDPSGRVEVDLRSIASAAASRFEELAPAERVSGTTTAGPGGRPVIELRGHLGAEGELGALRAAAETSVADLEAALGDDVDLRVVLSGPTRRRRRSQSREVRVVEETGSA